MEVVAFCRAVTIACESATGFGPAASTDAPRSCTAASQRRVVPSGRMFFVRYLGSELRRRRGRTILTVLGLALGVALVIVISALTRGLDRAQSKALDPLSSIGTDLTVTRAAQTDAAAAGPEPGGFGGGRELIDA